MDSKKHFIFEAHKIPIISGTKVRRNDRDFVATKKMESFYESINIVIERDWKSQVGRKRICTHG